MTAPQDNSDTRETETRGGCGTEVSFGILILLYCAYLLAVALGAYFFPENPETPLK